MAKNKAGAALPSRSQPNHAAVPSTTTVEASNGVKALATDAARKHELRMKQLDIYLKEVDQRFTEMRDYNNRYQQAMLLYLSALGAALGLTVSGKLSIAAIRQYSDAPVVIYLFIALNLLVLFHGVTLSSWSMSYAKYNAVFLAPRVAELAEVEDGPVSFDHWGSDVKAVAVRARGIGYMMWFALVLVTCVASLSLADIGAYARAGTGQCALTVVAAITLPALLLLTLHTAFSESFMTQHYFERNPPDVRTKVWVVTLTSWLGIVGVSVILVAARW